MKPLYLIAASAVALTAAACGPRTPPARAALDCPANQGDLTRTSASPDGKACTYVSSDGAEVTLQLVSVQGGVDSTLSTIETHLLANRQQPEEGDKAAEGGKPAEGDKGKKDETATEAAGSASADIHKDVDRAVAEATADAKASGVRVEVGKDGKTTVVAEDGGSTHVNLPGIHITANEDDESAQVQVGPLHINANGDDESFTYHFGPRSVRLRGEALNPEKRGVRASFIYVGKDLPDGYRYVGYEAGGPKTGPIAIAVVKGKSGDGDHDEIASDVTRLVRKNGGV